MLLHSAHSKASKRKLSSLQEEEDKEGDHHRHQMTMMMNQTSSFTAPPSPFHVLQIEEEDDDEENMHHSHVRHIQQSHIRYIPEQEQDQEHEQAQEDHIFGFFGKKTKVCTDHSFEEDIIHGSLNLFSDDLYSFRDESGVPGFDFSYQHSDQNLSSGSSTPSAGGNPNLLHLTNCSFNPGHHESTNFPHNGNPRFTEHDESLIFPDNCSPLHFTEHEGNPNFPQNGNPTFTQHDDNPTFPQCGNLNFIKHNDENSSIDEYDGSPNFPHDGDLNFSDYNGDPSFSDHNGEPNNITDHINGNPNFNDQINGNPNFNDQINGNPDFHTHHGSLLLTDLSFHHHHHHHHQQQQQQQQREPISDDHINSFYESSEFCKIPLCEDVTVGTADSSDCYAACPAGSLVAPPRAHSDPSLDPQFFEFGTVHIPVILQHGNSTVREIFKPCNRLSLELFGYHLGDGKALLLQPNWVELTEDGSCPDGSYQQKNLTHSYKALIDELIFNEAQGQLQVIITPSPELEFDLEGTVDIKVFLKRQRDDEVLVLKELLQELFPQDSELHDYLNEVEEIRNWSERTDDWTTFSGLLSDLESEGYDEAPHPVGLTVPLRSYQLQSLQFMLDAEKREGGLLSINYHKLPSTSTSSEPLLYSASFGHLMEFRKGVSCGGFLCEEMGLGKTIEILALILSNPCPIDKATAPSFSQGTLIVCPVSIVGQWANEVKSKLAANLSIYMYHGSKRIRDPKKLSKFDIVITTYATLGSDFSKATQATRHGSGFAEQFCPLLSVNWWRVVLDESHTVKDPAPLHSRACARLKAERRWCCTGTPINTSIYDLYGQFLFLKLEPLDNKDVFRKRIGRPYERHCKNEDQTVLLWTLNKMMIRHTKQQKLNGRELLKLPPKTEQDIIVTFTPEERVAYDAVYQKVLAKFEQFRSWGPTIVSKNILQIMSLLLPLRRLCSGGFISKVELHAMEYVKRESNTTAVDSSPDSGKISPTEEKEGEQLEVECGICFEIMECPTRTPCKHWFCQECVMSVLGAGTLSCPTCKSSLQSEQLEIFDKPSGLPLLETDFSIPSPSSGNGCDERLVTGVHMNSKLETLLADLAKVREESSGAKVLIFSQFTQTIAWLKNEFKNQGITYRFISGDMPMKKRAQAIEAFQKDPPTTVFLLSIRTGAVGLTLTAASHVYMLEPCLNPALEEQAVGRCWRMGQERPVVIKRLYVADSVEANILKLLQNRRTFQSKPLSTQELTEPSRTKAGKNSVTDVAGCIRSDKQNLRLSEFEILFS